jgi:hypothetical protein
MSGGCSTAKERDDIDTAMTTRKRLEILTIFRSTDLGRVDPFLSTRFAILAALPGGRS